MFSVTIIDIIWINLLLAKTKSPILATMQSQIFDNNAVFNNCNYPKKSIASNK